MVDKKLNIIELYESEYEKINTVLEEHCLDYISKCNVSEKDIDDAICVLSVYLTSNIHLLSTIGLLIKQRYKHKHDTYLGIMICARAVLENYCKFLFVFEEEDEQKKSHNAKCLYFLDALENAMDWVNRYDYFKDSSDTDNCNDSKDLMRKSLLFCNEYNKKNNLVNLNEISEKKHIRTAIHTLKKAIRIFPKLDYLLEYNALCKYTHSDIFTIARIHIKKVSHEEFQEHNWLRGMFLKDTLEKTITMALKIFEQELEKMEASYLNNILSCLKHIECKEFH